MSLVDDLTISDAAKLWRRIREIQGWYKSTADGSVRPTSAAFLDDTPHRQLSVHLAALTTLKQVIEGRPAESVAEITGKVPRAHQHLLVRKPNDVPRPPDPSHVVICPPEGASRSTRKRAARCMAESAEWRHVGTFLREAFPGYVPPGESP